MKQSEEKGVNEQKILLHQNESENVQNVPLKKLIDKETIQFPSCASVYSKWLARIVNFAQFWVMVFLWSL